MKWTFEHLLEEWDALVKRSTSREEFATERDILIAASGWTKLEFYSEIDRRAFEEHAQKNQEIIDAKLGETGTHL